MPRHDKLLPPYGAFDSIGIFAWFYHFLQNSFRRLTIYRLFTTELTLRAALTLAIYTKRMRELAAFEIARCTAADIPPLGHRNYRRARHYLRHWDRVSTMGEDIKYYISLTSRTAITASFTASTHYATRWPACRCQQFSLKQFHHRRISSSYHTDKYRLSPKCTHGPFIAHRDYHVSFNDLW
jgi:hypothetical protein